MDALVQNTMRVTCSAGQLDLFIFIESILDQYNIDSHELPLMQLVMKLDSIPYSEQADAFYAIYDDTLNELAEEMGYVFNDTATLRDIAVVLESLLTFTNFEDLTSMRDIIDNASSNIEAMSDLLVLVSDMQADHFMSIIAEMDDDLIKGLYENLHLDSLPDEPDFDVDNTKLKEITERQRAYFAFNNNARELVVAQVPCGFKFDTYMSIIESNIKLLLNPQITENVVFAALISIDTHGVPLMAIKDGIRRLNMEGTQGAGMIVAGTDLLTRFEKFLLATQEPAS